MKQYDVGIIGSGPAGSVLSAALANVGRSVLLVDRGKHPRFAVGESSTPIADGLIAEIAESFDLPELAPLARFGSWRTAYPDLLCGKKRGFSYFAHLMGREEIVDDASGRLVVAASPCDDVSDTQWYRAGVDRFLCEMAVARGAHLREQTQIAAVKRYEDGWQMTLQGHADDEVVRVAFLVDASGGGRVLPRLLGLTDRTNELWTRTASCYTHAQRLAPFSETLAKCGHQIDVYPFHPDDAAQHHVTADGWLWRLRFLDGLTSVGWTYPAEGGERRLLAADSLPGPLAAACEKYPSLRAALDGMQLADTPGHWIVSGRLQAYCGDIVGPRWALVPTTAVTLDPLHSTGLAHALSGSARIARILSGPSPFCEHQWSDYASQVHCEVRLLDRLVSLAYRTLDDFHGFTAACMLYFAVAIRYEELRQSDLGRANAEAAWGADVPAVCEVVRRGENLLAAYREAGSPAARELLIQKISGLCLQLTTVPLMRPENDGLYAYTFAG